MPATVAKIEPTGFAIFPTGAGSWFSGPFANGSNLYAVLQGDVPDNLVAALVVYKSTDGGNTWVLMDHTHSPVISGGQGWWSTRMSGTKIFMLGYSNTNYTLWGFDTATDTWISLGAALGSNPIGFADLNGAVGTYKEITFRPAMFTIRSDGSFVAPGIQMENVGGFKARTRFDVFSSTFVNVATDVLAGMNGQAVEDIVTGAILGANDRTHIFFLEYGGKTLQTRTVTSANAVIANVQVATGLFDPGGANTFSLAESIGTPAYNAATGEIAIPFKDTNNHVKIARAQSADSPVWTIEQVDSSSTLLINGDTDGANVLTAYYDGNGNIAVVWLDNSATINLMRATKGKTGWFTETLASMSIPNRYPAASFTELGAAPFNGNVFALTVSDSNVYATSTVFVADFVPPVPNPRIDPTYLPKINLPNICCDRKPCIMMLSQKVIAARS